jgi:hypothetical protein
MLPALSAAILFAWSVGSFVCLVLVTVKMFQHRWSSHPRRSSSLVLFRLPGRVRGCIDMGARSIEWPPSARLKPMQSVRRRERYRVGKPPSKSWP